MKNNKLWFTLIEILIWMLIFSIIIIWSFKVLSQLWIARIKLITETSMEKKAIYFSQKLFEEIKQWWTIDYEEYFNRKIFENNSPEYLSWHYKNSDWFWNYWHNWNINSNTYWSWFYYCSGIIENKWCLTWSLNTLGIDQFWKKQRYWEYVLQFISFGWDYDWDWNIIWDNDDEWLWKWPKTFDLNKNLTELYLISADKKHRTYFRYSVKIDPNAPNSKKNCSISDNWKTYSWSWCLWTIEFLKLDWKDWWISHNTTSSWAFDWKIDTWIVNKRFSWKTNGIPNNSIIAWSWGYWQELFDDSINVENVEFYLYPNKDTNLTWKENNLEQTAPYLKLKMTLSPSWKTKRQIKGKIPKINISTIISLSDILSN